MTESFKPRLIGDITCSGKRDDKGTFFTVTTDMKLVYEDWEGDNDCPDEYKFSQYKVDFLPDSGVFMEKLYNFIYPLEFTIIGQVDDKCNYMRHYDITIKCTFDNDGIKITNTTFEPTTISE